VAVETPPPSLGAPPADLAFGPAADLAGFGAQTRTAGLRPGVVYAYLLRCAGDGSVTLTFDRGPTITEPCVAQQTDIERTFNADGKATALTVSGTGATNWHVLVEAR
jgi:hypothetical protein